MFFNQGGGGGFHFGGGGGPFGGGGGGGERQIFKGSEVDEWGEKQYEEMVSSPDLGQFTAVVFYKSQASGDLKSAILEVHKTYSSMMKVAAINCGIKQGVCNNEKISDGKSRLMLFWKDGEKKTLQKKKVFYREFQRKTTQQVGVHRLARCFREPKESGSAQEVVPAGKRG